VPIAAGRGFVEARKPQGWAFCPFPARIYSRETREGALKQTFDSGNDFEALTAAPCDIQSLPYE
jgi:hypothetical protein